MESPSKCKAIETALGGGYRCRATLGHIRCLNGIPSLNVPSYEPDYAYLPKMGARCAALKGEANKAAEVLIATDADREGEAIAWHVMEVLGIPLDAQVRVVFHEITPAAIRSAVASPRCLDMGMVESQKARQMVDLLVGYTVSPYLWHIQACLSAGRCQTPALRLVYERATAAVQAERHLHTVGYFTAQNLSFIVSPPINDVEEARQFLFETTGFEHTLTIGDARPVSIDPPRPLDTIDLQSMASSKLGMAPATTMAEAQSLYEAGLITYMRTDAHAYATEFAGAVKRHIETEYGHSYVGTPPCGEPGAHESIRPTDIRRVLKGRDKRARLYAAIRDWTLASCMTPAELVRRRDVITAPLGREYVRTSEMRTFLGWHIVIDTPVPLGFDVLASVKRSLEPREVKCSETVRGERGHYDEMSLIKKLDSLGIGRPSTFVSIVKKLSDRGYVKVQNVEGSATQLARLTWRNRSVVESAEIVSIGGKKRCLCIQPVGVAVIEYLVERLEPLFDYDYTATLEESLDLIASGRGTAGDLCRHTEECLRSRLVRLPECHRVPPPRQGRGRGRGGGRGRGRGRGYRARKGSSDAPRST